MIFKSIVEFIAYKIFIAWRELLSFFAWLELQRRAALELWAIAMASGGLYGVRRLLPQH